MLNKNTFERVKQAATIEVCKGNMKNPFYLVCSLFQLAAIVIFCIGFFPQQVVLKETSKFVVNHDLQEASSPVFTKLIIVVIDALRSDFMFQKDISHFSYLHGLLRSGEAWGYTAYSSPPTVTLPRLKGITTGSAPNFLDAILNVAEDDSSSSLKDQDSILNQFHMRDFKINFFGDDTWLKLFPLEFFNEYEGTNSFFVSDFEEVDYNVTRHLPYQLENSNEWDVLILHYLGLDHIGHKGGAHSKFMRAKHLEMDQIIKTIYETIDDKTLMVVLGDHGMNDLGNHGGSSAGETSAALSFLSKKLKNYKIPTKQSESTIPLETTSEDYKYLKDVQQVDLVPTLCMLFNIPIPKNSLGVLIDDFITLLPRAVSDIKVKENYLQLASLNSGYKPEFDGKPTSSILDEMKTLQRTIAMASTNYNYKFLFIGIGLMLLGTLTSLISNFELSVSFLSFVSISVVLGVSMFASSFIEEEHQLWWFFTIVVLLLQSLSIKQNGIVLICLRFIRGWNNSGQKYVYEGVLHNLLKQNTSIQWMLNLFTLLFIGISFYRNSNAIERIFSTILPMITVFSCLAYKATFAIVNKEHVPESLKIFAISSCSLYHNGYAVGEEHLADFLVPLARTFFLSLSSSLLILLSVKILDIKSQNISSKIAALLKLLLVFQTSSANIPLFLLFEIILTQISISPLLSLCMQNLTFFQLGGTNSIATVSLTNAYNGVSSNYNIYIVGVLMFISNFAPSIYWTLASMPKHQKDKCLELQHYYIIGLFLLLACYSLRHHLFIWSVFCPKLCYYAAWSLFRFLMDNFVTLLSFV